MERLHCIRESHGGSPQIVSLPTLPPPESFTRLATCWLGLRHGSLQWSQEYGTGLPFPFDVDYQDSTTFHRDVASHSDWDFELADSVWSGTKVDGAFPADFLDIPYSHDRSQTEQMLLPNPDVEWDNDEFLAAFFTRWSHFQVLRKPLTVLALGLVAHLAAFWLFFAAPSPSVTGFGGISNKPISVKLTEACEIDTPDDPSPASIDAPASSPSLARRDPKPEEKTEKELKKEELSALETKEIPSKPLTETQPIDSKSEVGLDSAHQKARPDPLVKQGPLNDSKSLQDSVASTPSVASPERKGALKAGDQDPTYKDRILSAIHGAAYYPRTAVRNMAHGKTVVCFTINKDGSLANVAIVSHADSKVLDEAALKIVKKASSNFPPIPDSLMKDQISYVVPIVFKKKR